MKRRLFTILSTISLLLFVAVVVPWARSYSVAHYVAMCSETREVGLISTVGHLLLYRETALGTFRWDPPFGLTFASKPAPPRLTAYAPAKTERYANFAGFGVMRGNNGHYAVRANFVPYWSLALATALLPTTWVRRWLAMRRNAGLCPSCGYDLRATPDRCPECGAAPAKPSA